MKPCVEPCCVLYYKYLEEVVEHALGGTNHNFPNGQPLKEGEETEKKGEKDERDSE